MDYLRPGGSGAPGRLRRTIGAQTEAHRLVKQHELTGDAWTYFDYDSRGNCTEIEEPDGTTYFTYNDADLVESIHHKNGAMNYFHYDALRRRYAVQDSTGLSYFTWDENGMNLLAERDAGGSVTAEYSHGRAGCATW